MLAISVTAQTVTVGSTSLQTWKGWEATAQTGLGDFLTTGQNYHDAALTAAVDIGINRLRTELPSGFNENTTDYWGNYVADGRDYSTNAAYAAMNANSRIPINDNADPNSINASGFKFSHIDWQVDNYVTPLKTKLAARGETLFWTLCYVHFSTSNQLHVDTPAEYGELVLAIWQHLNTTYGMVPDALEIFLEADNGAALVTSAEIAAMIIAARNRLVNAGFAKPYIIAPTTTTSPATLGFYRGVKTASATAGTYIDEVSRHRYGTAPDDTMLVALRNEVEVDGKKSSMLETDFNGTLANLHQDIEVGRVSAWSEFTISYPGNTDVGSTHFLVGTSSPWALTKNNRTKYQEHYMKYIRQNAVMKSVTNSSSNFRGVPFVNPNGKYVVPIRALTSGTVTVSGLPAGTYNRCRTIGDGNSAPTTYNSCEGNVTIGSGQNVTITFSGAGVGTVYDINYLANSAAPMQITTASLPNAVCTRPYNQTLQASGGSGSYVWSVSSGNLPAGLWLDSANGIIHGRARLKGTRNFTLTVHDSQNASATASQAFTVSSRLYF